MSEIEKVINTGYSVTIDDKDYTMRRLNTRDVFALARILAKGAQAIPADMLEGKGLDANTLAIALGAAIPLAEDEIIAFLASTLGISTEEFAQLPPEAVPVVLEILGQHTDVQAFFKAAARAAAILPKDRKTVQAL